MNAEVDAGRAADKAGSGAVAVKGLEQQLEAARREAAELREARLEAEAAHNRERLAHAGLLVRAGSAALGVMAGQGAALCKTENSANASASAHAHAKAPTLAVHPPTRAG